MRKTLFQKFHPAKEAGGIFMPPYKHLLDFDSKYGGFFLCTIGDSSDCRSFIELTWDDDKYARLIIGRLSIVIQFRGK